MVCRSRPFLSRLGYYSICHVCDCKTLASHTQAEATEFQEKTVMISNNGYEMSIAWQLPLHGMITNPEIKSLVHQCVHLISDHLQASSKSVEIIAPLPGYRVRETGTPSCLLTAVSRLLCRLPTSGRFEVDLPSSIICIDLCRLLDRCLIGRGYHLSWAS